MFLVSSLPPSYSNFIDAFMYGRKTLSLVKVKVVPNIRWYKRSQGIWIIMKG